MNLVDIKSWYVYFVPNCKHTTPIKDKFVVIAYIDQNPMGFFINSRITNWIQNRQNLLICVPSIPAADHSFLKHDSYVDCQSIYEFLPQDVDHNIGVVSEKTKSDLLDAIHACPKLERKYKKLILSNEGYPGYSME